MRGLGVGLAALLIAADVQAADNCAWFGVNPDAAESMPLLQRFQVRNRFDENYNQNAPASFAWQKSSDGTSSMANVGIRAPETECAPFRDQTRVAFAPVIEYAKNSNASGSVNTLNAGLSAQVLPDLGRNLYLPLLLDLRATRDFARHATSEHGSLLLAPRPRWPGVNHLVHVSWTGSGAGVLWDLRPYLGVEYYNHMEDITGDDALSYGLFRAVAELWPFPHLPFKRLQLQGEYEYRSRIRGGVAQKDPRVVSVGATYYFDPDESFGLGVTYTRGETPDAAFEFDETTQLSLEVKFGKGNE